ncbi:DUF6790 family protein [Methylocystis parvus]|uniref:DUF4345 domain-containing protein n=1 Tax=Methylocystis parvus TaxID=134 RepID=A0A6B8MBS7_9HYPH|nr:DUF6790 family protein [Methylocystis parvus]QGN00182.1 hypothetical protein F7D14_21715 [Methylocystis parvus]WBK02508.1 hypothetical protein MMG94_20920 [Methylocystis parvus OBBP]
MIAGSIAFFIRNLPAALLVSALLLGAAGLPRRSDVASRFLGWILLLPIGVTGLWAGIAHIFYPSVAAAYIGWEDSPLQYEVGMADLAIGVTACVAFWRTWDFRAAAVCAASIFLLGDAIGHVRQMLTTGNFTSGNAGVPFYMDIIAPLLAIGLLIAARRASSVGR